MTHCEHQLTTQSYFSDQATLRPCGFITLCALFSGPARLTPKVQVLLDFFANTSEQIETRRHTERTQAPALGYGAWQC
jgi:hypothetical protein